MSHEGIIRYNGRYYIPVISSQTLDLLDSITIPYLLVLDLHATSSPPTSASPSRIMLLHGWTDYLLTSVLVLFINDNEEQILFVHDVHINRQVIHRWPIISQWDYNAGTLLFGHLQNSISYPPFIILTTRCHEIDENLGAGQVTPFPRSF
jgi:hypothetical protein